MYVCAHVCVSWIKFFGNKCITLWQESYEYDLCIRNVLFIMSISGPGNLILHLASNTIVWWITLFLHICFQEDKNIENLVTEI